MYLAALLLLTGSLQEDTGEQFYKFKKGTTWVYDQTEKDEMGQETKSRSVTTVIEEGEGKVKLESKDYLGDEKEPLKTEVIVLSVKDGFLGLSSDGEGGMPPIPIYKLGSKKGDTWTHKLGEGDEGMEVEGANLGSGEVQVPAGTYKDVTEVEVKSALFTFKLHMAPKVGLIKFEVVDKVTLQLKEFTPAK